MAPKGRKRLRRGVLFDEAEESDAVETTASPEPAGQTPTEALAEAVPAPATPPVRVFRRPVPTTPTTQQPSQNRREETHRCDPHIPTNAATGLPSTGMFLMLLSAWADKAPFDNGIKAFITKGDRLKWIGERTDPRGKGFQMRVISPIHVYAKTKSHHAPL